VAQVAEWRAALWQLCHGSPASAVATPLPLDLEGLAFVALRLQRALAALAGVLSESGFDPQGGSLATEVSHNTSHVLSCLAVCLSDVAAKCHEQSVQHANLMAIKLAHLDQHHHTHRLLLLSGRVRHALGSLLASLGLAAGPPPPPLAWRAAGHPQLPATLDLCQLQQRLHSAASTLRCMVHQTAPDTYASELGFGVLASRLGSQTVAACRLPVQSCFDSSAARSQ
jgi:hypothetical protein